MTNARARFAIIDAIGAHGGMHYYTDNQARALVGQGHDVTVYSLPASTDADATYAKVQTFERIYGRAPKAVRGLRFARDLAMALLSARARRTDVCIYHLFKMDRFDRFTFATARRLGMKTIAIVHDVERLDQPNARPELAAIAENTNLMAVHNAFSEAALRSALGTMRVAVSVIPSGNYVAQFPDPPSKAEARARLGLPRDKTIILFFGNPRREKGLHVLLDAMVAHRDETNLLLLVAGKMKPEEEAEYRAFADRHGLGERVRFDIGHIADEAVAGYYRSADIVALPYLRIYESAVALMAMSLERPILASDLPPLRDVVVADAGDRGLLFAVGDASALSARIGQIVRNPDQLAVYGDNASRYAVRDRHWDVTGRMLSKAAESF